MLSDSIKIAVDSGTTGFYVTCGTSNPVYVRIPYKPGQHFYKIIGKMPCDKKSKSTLTIEPMKI
jgi:hypothetical protein